MPEESLEELVEKIFRDYVVPLYPKDKPIKQMTSYEIGQYNFVLTIVTLTAQAIYARMKKGIEC